jgi:hypothetical protein
MADSKPAEVEAAVNPAEVPMSDAPVASAPEVTAGAQEDSTSKVANIDTVDTKTEEKPAEEKAAVSEESSAVGSEEKVKTTEKEKDGDDSKGNRDRGKYDRNAKRGGGHQNNQRNKKPRYALCLLHLCDLTDSLSAATSPMSSPTWQSQTITTRSANKYDRRLPCARWRLC